MALSWLQALLSCCRDPDSSNAEQKVTGHSSTTSSADGRQDINGGRQRRSNPPYADRDKELPTVPADKVDDQQGIESGSLDSSIGNRIDQYGRDPRIYPVRGIPTPRLYTGANGKTIAAGGRDSGVALLSPAAGNDGGGYSSPSPTERPNVSDNTISSLSTTRPLGHPYAPPSPSATHHIQSGDQGKSTRSLNNRRRLTVTMDRSTVSGGEVAQNPDTWIVSRAQAGKPPHPHVAANASYGVTRVGDQSTSPFSTPLPPLAENDAHPTQPGHGPADSRGHNTISPSATINESTVSIENLATAPDRNAERSHSKQLHPNSPTGDLDGMVKSAGRRSRAPPSSLSSSPPARAAPVKQGFYGNRGGNVIPDTSGGTTEEFNVAGEYVVTPPEEGIQGDAGKLPHLHIPPYSPNKATVVPQCSSSGTFPSGSHFPQPAESGRGPSLCGRNPDDGRGRNQAPSSPIDESATRRKQVAPSSDSSTGSNVGIIPRHPLPMDDPDGLASTTGSPFGTNPSRFSPSPPASSAASPTQPVHDSNSTRWRDINDNKALEPLPSPTADGEQVVHIPQVIARRTIGNSLLLLEDLQPSRGTTHSKAKTQTTMSTTRRPYEQRKDDTRGSRIVSSPSSIDESALAGGQVSDPLRAQRSAGKLPHLRSTSGAPDGLTNVHGDLSSTHRLSPPSIPAIGNDPPVTQLRHHSDVTQENASEHPVVVPSATTLFTTGERQAVDAPDSKTVYGAREVSSFPTQTPEKALVTTHSQSSTHPPWAPNSTPASGDTCPTRSQQHVDATLVYSLNGISPRCPPTVEQLTKDPLEEVGVAVNRATSHTSTNNPPNVPAGIPNGMVSSSANVSVSPASVGFRGDHWDAMFINNAGGDVKLTSGRPDDPDGLASATSSQCSPHPPRFSSSPPALNATISTQPVQGSNGYSTRWRDIDDDNNQALDPFPSSTVDAKQAVNIPDSNTSPTIGNSPSLAGDQQPSRSTAHSKEQTQTTMSTTRRAPHEQRKSDTRWSRIVPSPSNIDESTITGGQVARDALLAPRSVSKLPRSSPIAGAPEEVIKVCGNLSSIYRTGSPSIPTIGNDPPVTQPGQHSNNTEESVVNEHTVVCLPAASIPIVGGGQIVGAPDASTAENTQAGETSSPSTQVPKTTLDATHSQSRTPRPMPASGDTYPTHSQHHVATAPGHRLDDTSPRRPAVEHLTKDRPEEFGMAVDRATSYTGNTGANNSLEVPEVRPRQRLNSSGSRSSPTKVDPGSVSPSSVTFSGSHWRARSMTINNAGGDIKFMSGRPGWDVLAKHAAPRSFHTSEVVARLGKCDPNTRVKVLNRICEWAVRQGAPRSLFMTGAAGSGKTAIALTTAHLLEQQAALAATFFFSSMDDTRSNLSSLIPSIAYQLGLRIPSLADSIGDLVAHNQHVFAASLEEQVMQLIVKPWKLLLSATVPDPPLTILIDAADECQGEWEQDSLVALVTNQSLWVGTPFRFFVTARPEVIHAATGRFDESHCIRLSDDTRYDANEDIRTSLRIHLPKLVKKDVFALEKDIDAIVAASSGQYIYPATAIGYIEEGKRDSPMGRLKAIVGWILNSPRAETQNPLQRLDELFENILLLAMGKYAHNPSNGGDTSKNPLVLLLQAYARLNIKTVLQPTPEHEDVHDLVLGLDNGSFNSVVYDVRCLVRVRELTEHGPIVEFYHRMCLEFLQSRAKGEGLHFDKDRIDLYLLKRLCAVFIDSSDDAFALIERNDGVFTDNDKAWTNCTSVFLLGGVLKSMLSESSSKKGRITRSLKAKDRKSLNRFFSPKNRGWEKLKEWALLVSRYHQLQEDESTKLALLEWGQYLHTLLQYQDSTQIRDVKNVLDAMRMTG